MKRQARMVAIGQIALDTENPRIRAALERQGIHDPNEDQLRFHLKSAMIGGGSGGSGYRALKESIKANGGASQPITLVKVKGQSEKRYRCIDGNTRVSIYKELSEEKTTGDWKEIYAVILEAKDGQEEARAIEELRMVSHIVGPREWSPYRRAKYINELRNKRLLSWREIEGRCGGRVKKDELEEDLAAYELMEEYRESLGEEGNFKEIRFSAYRELVRRRVLPTLQKHGMTADDFHRWVAKDVLAKDEQVRHLKGVLEDEEARAVLREEKPTSLQEAIDIVDDKRKKDQRRSEEARILQGMGIMELGRALTARVNGATWSEIKALSKEQDELKELVTDLRENADELGRQIT